MLPNNVIDAQIEGNLDGETVRMEIDASATAHLMTVLTDLYNDRIMAFIREYATNAWDAHVEAGVTRPIEITLPSRMSSYYRIKDYGIGLDVDGIRDIYSKYGASTKRSSNAFNGMLGLGCKSAMTYAAQFSIISVKDGMKYNVAVSRGADGVGEMQVIDTTPTNESNGVEIVIPVKTNDVWAVAEKVAYFFQWWEPGTVLVNGKAPKRFEGREIAKNLYMIDGLEKDLIVMGNVPYAVPYEDGIYGGEKDTWGYSRKNFGVVYFAEMGEVTFAPNRESLSTTQKTKDAVDKAKSLFIANLKKAIQKEFDAIDSHVKVLKHRRELESRYRDIQFDGFTYKGMPIPTEDFEANYRLVPVLDYQGKPVVNVNGQPRMQKEHDHFMFYDADGGSPESKRTALSLDTIERYSESMVFLVNAPKSLTAHQKSKIRKAYQADILERMYVFTTPEATKPGGVWTDGIKVQDWSVVRDFKISSNSTSDSTKHRVYEIDGTWNDRTIPDAEKIVYTSPTFFNEDSYYGPKRAGYVKYVNEAGYTFVELSKNRNAKFAREHKNALTLPEFVQQRINEYEKGLDAETKTLLGIDSEDVYRLLALKGVDIDDADMVELIKKVDLDKFTTATKLRERHQAKTRHLTARMTEIAKVKPFANYPLVKCLNSDEIKAHRKHVAEYINAVAGSKKGN